MVAGRGSARPASSPEWEEPQPGDEEREEEEGLLSNPDRIRTRSGSSPPGGEGGTCAEGRLPAGVSCSARILRRESERGGGGLSDLSQVISRKGRSSLPLL